MSDALPARTNSVKATTALTSTKMLLQSKAIMGQLSTVTLKQMHAECRNKMMTDL